MPPIGSDFEYWTELADLLGGTLVQTKDGWRIDGGETDVAAIHEAMVDAGYPPTEGRLHVGVSIVRETKDGRFEPDWIPLSYGRDAAVAWDQAIESLETFEGDYEDANVVGISVRAFPT